MEQKDELPPKVAFRKQCLHNAANLLSSAQSVINSRGATNISYHLILLALEEVGKTVVAELADLKENISTPTVPSKKFDDHEEKIFYALWSALLDSERFGKQSVAECKDLASTFHSRRLSTLYVPVGAIWELPTTEEVSALYELTKGRLDLASSTGVKILTKDDAELLNFFFTLLQSPEEKVYVFSKASMEQLASSNDVEGWIRWIKARYEERQEHNRTLAEKELARQQPGENESREPKWKVKVKLISASHSIRQKPLNEWNSRFDWIELRSGNKNELFMILHLPKSVPVQGLWAQGHDLSQKLMVALNIGSFGFFFWELPKRIATFAESIFDVETNSKVVLQRSPALAIDWRQEALTSRQLELTAMAFVYFAREQKVPTIFAHYLSGLTFMAKIDIDFILTTNAFMSFWSCLEEAFISHESGCSADQFEERFRARAHEFGVDKDFVLSLLELSKKAKEANESLKDITLKEVAMMKVLCDVYLIRMIRASAQSLIDSEQPNIET